MNGVQHSTFSIIEERAFLLYLKSFLDDYTFVNIEIDYMDQYKEKETQDSKEFCFKPKNSKTVYSNYGSVKA